MRFWREKLILPIHVRENEHLNQVAGVKHNMWPDCMKCTKAEMRRLFGREDFRSNTREYEQARVMVTRYGVESCGRTPGKEGTDYTDEFAEHHGEKDIIRIEGFRWDKVAAEATKLGDAFDWTPILAAIKALPFFEEGNLRVIPKSQWLNLTSHLRRRN